MWRYHSTNLTDDYDAGVSLLQGVVPMTYCCGFLPILGQLDMDQIRLGISGLLDQARIPRLEVRSDLSPAGNFLISDEHPTVRNSDYMSSS